MKRDPKAFRDADYDVLVVGGGAFGCCAAWEAASRGLKVGLIERADFCGATSANHFKVVHGGIRYLQHLDLPRVRESIRERSILLRIAPHLVQPVQMVMPTYGGGLRSKLILGAGLQLYDLLACDRNRHLADPARRLPRSRLISAAECRQIYPHLADDLTGAGVFSEGQFYNPPRLAWSFLRSALGAGARALNYAEAREFIRDGNGVLGVIAEDRLSGERLAIRAKIVLNSAGPWAAPLLRRALELRLAREPAFSRDLGFAVRRRLTGRHALACQVATKDPDAILSREGRHVFLVPWRDYTLIGVWHQVHQGEPDDVGVTRAELEGYLDEVNRTYPAYRLGLDDISMVYAGLTLFGDNRPDAQDLRFGKRSLLIDHADEHGLGGLLTMIGVRATMARGTAAKAIERVIRRLGVAAPPSRSAEMPLHGGDIADFEGFVGEAIARHGAVYGEGVVRSLVHTYGSAYREVLELAGRDPRLAAPLDGSRVIGAQIVHGVRDEMAQRLGDVVLRRTDLGSGGHPGAAALRAGAQLMAAELGWDEARAQQEIAAVEAVYPWGGRA